MKSVKRSEIKGSYVVCPKCKDETLVLTSEKLDKYVMCSNCGCGFRIED